MHCRVLGPVTGLRTHWYTVMWRNDRLGRFPCQLRRRVYDDAAVKMQPVVLCVRGKPACQLEGFVSAILNCASYRRTNVRDDV